MNKIILVFVFAAIVILNKALVLEALGKPCRRQCSSRIPSEIVCAQDKDGRNCHKLKECRLRELNCRLRSRKQSMLLQTYMQRCRFIKGMTGDNKCAPPLPTEVIMRDGRAHRTWMRADNVYVYPCSVANGKRACYRCPGKGDICQLLTACQAERANCQRRY